MKIYKNRTLIKTEQYKNTGQLGGIWPFLSKKIPHTGDKASLDRWGSSTDTTLGWTKNTRKPNFFEKGKKSSKTQKLKTSRDMPILTIYPSTRGL